MPFDYNNAVHNKQVSGGSAAEYLAAAGSDGIHTNTFYLSAENRFFIGKTVNSLLELALKTDLTVNYIAGVASNNHIIHAVNAGVLSSTLKLSAKAGNRTSVIVVAGTEGVFTEGYTVHPDSAGMIEIVGGNQIRLLPMAINDVMDAGTLSMINYLNSINYSATNKVIQTGDFVICNSEQKIYIHKGTFTGTITDFQEMRVPLPTQATVRTWFGQGNGITYNNASGENSVRLGTNAGLLSFDGTGALVSSLPTWGQVSGKPVLAAVATSGSYVDLLNKPTIPSAQVNSDWSATTGVAAILNKPTNNMKTDAGQTITANHNFTGDTIMSSLMRQNLRDAEGNCYYDAFDVFPKIIDTNLNIRVATQGGNYRNLLISGNGNLSWDGAKIYHSGNFNVSTDNYPIKLANGNFGNGKIINSGNDMVLINPNSLAQMGVGSDGNVVLYNHGNSGNVGLGANLYYDGLWKQRNNIFYGGFGMSMNMYPNDSVKFIHGALINNQVLTAEKWKLNITNGDVTNFGKLQFPHASGNLILSNNAGIGIIAATVLSLQATQITLSATNIFAPLPDETSYLHLVTIGGDGISKLAKQPIANIVKATNGLNRASDGNIKTGGNFTEVTTSNLSGFSYGIVGGTTGKSVVFGDVATSPFMLVSGKVRNISDDFECTATGRGYIFKDDAGNVIRLRCNAQGNFYRELLS
jgi:hypothetical protein